MRISVGLTLLIALGAASYVFMAAKSDDHQAEPKENKAVATPLKPEWQVGEAIRVENMTVFPITADKFDNTDGFITLDEGMRSGKITITEFGADGRPRAPEQRRQSLDNAQVNKLALT